MIIITKVTIKGITYYKEKIPIGRNADGTVKYKQITASVLMGRSYIKMTANIYTHISDEQKKKAIQNLSF